MRAAEQQRARRAGDPPSERPGSPVQGAGEAVAQGREEGVASVLSAGRPVLVFELFNRPDVTERVLARTSSASTRSSPTSDSRTGRSAYGRVQRRCCAARARSSHRLVLHYAGCEVGRPARGRAPARAPRPWSHPARHRAGPRRSVDVGGCEDRAFDIFTTRPEAGTSRQPASEPTSGSATWAATAWSGRGSPRPV